MNLDLLELIITFVLIFISGFLAAAEIAIASFGPNKIEDLKEQKDPSAKAFEKIQKDTNAFFGTIQITTHLTLLAAAMLGFHVCFSFISHNVFDIQYFAPFNSITIISVIAALFLISFFTMIFGILIPKALGFKYAEKIGKSSVNLILFLTVIFKYLVRTATYLSNLILIPFGEKTNFSQTRFSEDEIRIIISEGVKSGAIDQTEQEIIENLFDFNDLRANEVMVPRTEVVALDLTDQEDEMKDEIMRSNHSIIPVYINSIDNIVGVIHTKDLMKQLILKEQFEIKNLVRPAYFIPETKLISEILKEMQIRGERMAIVMDEYGGCEGVITMEDIIEEIVGDIRDNSIVEEQQYSRLPDGSYYVVGSMYIDDFNDVFSINLPYSAEYNTVAGFISDCTGKILNTGEKVQYGNLSFELIKKIRQKMVQFKVHSLENDFVENKKNT